MKRLILFSDNKVWRDFDYFKEFDDLSSIPLGSYVYHHEMEIWYVWQEGLISVSTDSVPEIYRAWILIL